MLNRNGQTKLTCTISLVFDFPVTCYIVASQFLWKLEYFQECINHQMFEKQFNFILCMNESLEIYLQRMHVD